MATSIFELIEQGDSVGIRALLAADPATRDARDSEGLSPLMRAAYRGRGPAFEAILDAGAPTDPWDRLISGYADRLPSPDAWSPDGFTPLHLAAFAHNAAGARVLLEAGADPDALSRASFARVTPLGTCAFAGATEVARILLEHGADPSIAADGDTTPLDVARANGHADLAELLGR
jgi:uncharacterized protein